MSKASEALSGGEQYTTDAYHDGREVAVRATSKYSRTKHDPVTDADGTVVFYAPTDRNEPGPCKVVDADHPDAQPRPECGLPNGNVHDTDFRVSPIPCVDGRPVCSNCEGTNGDPATGAGAKTFARIARYGENWGE